RPKRVDHAAGQQEMGSRQDRETDDVDVFLDRLGHDLVGRSLQPGINDLEARVAQRVGHHLGATIVAVEPGLRDEDLHAGRNAGSQRGFPVGSSAMRSGAKRTVWPIATFAGSASTRIENTRRPSIFTIAKIRGPTKPAGSPTSWIVKACIIPSPDKSTQSKASEPHSPQNARGGQAT